MQDSVSRRRFSTIASCLAALFALGVGACGGLSETERSADAEAEVVRQELRALRGRDSAGWSVLRVSRRPWLAIEPIRVKTHQDLDFALLAEDAVTLPLGDVRDDGVLAARIEAAAGVEVSLTGPSSGRSSGFAVGLRDGWTPAGGIWTGPLDRLLDAWCAAGGYEWVVEDGRIRVVRRKTVTFGINALSGRQEYSARTSATDSGRGEGSSGSASQTLGTRVVFNPWPEIVEQLKDLAGVGAALAVSEGNASVTVSTVPEGVRRVRAYLTHLNRRILRPVTVTARVYSVRFDRAEDYQLGISALLDDILGSRLRVEVGSGQIAIVRPQTNSLKGAGSFNATVRALQSVGRASRVLSADIPTLNGKPALFYELLKTAYLKEISTTSTESGSQTTLTPGEVSSGFSLSYTARITAPDEVLVRFVASLRDRPTFAVFGTENAQIQLPVYGDRGVQATQRLRRGETLVVSGFSDRSSSSERGGSFDPSVPVPEGLRKAVVAKTEQVLLLSAEIGAPLGISETVGTEL